jgi:hypothetical protein
MRSQSRILATATAVAVAVGVWAATASGQVTAQPTPTTMARGLINPGAWITSSGLYLSSATSEARTAKTTLRRVNATTGQVAASQTIDGQPVALAEAGSKVWVETQTQLAGVASGPAVVTALNPQTLQIERTIKVGAPSTQAVGLVVADGSVWATDMTELLRIDTATVTVTKTVAASANDGKDAVYTGVATDGRNRSLVTTVQNRTNTRIQRRRASTGTVEARSTAFKSYGAVVDSVFDNGAWTSVDAGQSGYLERLSLSTLEVTARPAAAAGSTATWARVYGGHLFVAGLGASPSTYCGNTTTGQPEASLSDVRHGLLLRP